MSFLFLPEYGILGTLEINEGVTAFRRGVVVSEGGRLEGLREFHGRLDDDFSEFFSRQPGSTSPLWEKFAAPSAWSGGN